PCSSANRAPNAGEGLPVTSPSTRETSVGRALELKDDSRCTTDAARHEGNTAHAITATTSAPHPVATMPPGIHGPGFGSITRARPNGVAIESKIPAPSATPAAATATTNARTSPSHVRSRLVMPSDRNAGYSSASILTWRAIDWPKISSETAPMTVHVIHSATAWRWNERLIWPRSDWISVYSISLPPASFLTPASNAPRSAWPRRSLNVCSSNVAALEVYSCSNAGEVIIPGPATPTRSPDAALIPTTRTETTTPGFTPPDARFDDGSASANDMREPTCQW